VVNSEQIPSKEEAEAERQALNKRPYMHPYPKSNMNL